MENLEALVWQLCKYSNELPWLEFKHNNYDPDMIGEDIAALANGAALEEKTCAYFIWGIDDKSHEIVGTQYDLQNLKKGGEELENWLRGLLSPNVDFDYKTVNIDGVKVGVMMISCALNQPVTFRKTGYIRVGSYTKKLMEVPALESRLWKRIQNKDFESQAAAQDLELPTALHMLDYGLYFDLTGTSQPSTVEGIAHYLLEEQMLILQDNGLYAISNMGAILFAKRLQDFAKLSRKAIRVVQYEGTNRMKMLREDTETKGYAVGFEEVMKYIEALTPSQEVISGAIREKKTA